jgi:hypothetical protein
VPETTKGVLFSVLDRIVRMERVSVDVGNS